MILNIPFDIGDRVILTLPDGYSQDTAIGVIKSFRRENVIRYEGKRGFTYSPQNTYVVKIEGGNEFTIPERDWDSLESAETD